MSPKKEYAAARTDHVWTNCMTRCIIGSIPAPQTRFQTQGAYSQLSPSSSINPLLKELVLFSLLYKALINKKRNRITSKPLFLQKTAHWETHNSNNLKLKYKSGHPLW